MMARVCNLAMSDAFICLWNNSIILACDFSTLFSSKYRAARTALSLHLCLSVFFVSFLLLFSENHLTSPRLFTVGSPQICHQLESHSVWDSADLRISAGKFLLAALHKHVLGYKIENLTVSDSGLKLLQSGPKVTSDNLGFRITYKTECKLIVWELKTWKILKSCWRSSGFTQSWPVFASLVVKAKQTRAKGILKFMFIFQFSLSLKLIFNKIYLIITN